MGSEASPEDNTIKCDDSCTTDSGSALDDEVCQGIDTVNVTNSHDNHNSDYQVSVVEFLHAVGQSCFGCNVSVD